MKKIILAGAVLMLIMSCKSTKYVNKDEQMLANSGMITRQEMEKTAEDFANAVAAHYKAKQGGTITDVFVALLPTVNDTSEEVQTAVYDDALVSALRKQGIYTVRVESRGAALKEMTFNQSGMADNALSLGKMKSPNYFVKTKLKENFFKSGKDRIMEHTIYTELQSIESQLVVWDDKATFRKKLANSGSGVGW